ncbi:MAG: hypothetical protein H6Q05_2437 [Acidobacteria bacterium]|nr:hypothetical protein [Acidobacteriota bacterium]
MQGRATVKERVALIRHPKHPLACARGTECYAEAAGAQSPARLSGLQLKDTLLPDFA